MLTMPGCQRSGNSPVIIGCHAATTAPRPRCGSAVPAWNTASTCTCSAKAAASPRSIDCAKLRSRFHTSHSAALMVAAGAVDAGALPEAGASVAEPANTSAIDQAGSIDRDTKNLRAKECAAA
jgi:hypothetical protein